MPWLVARGIVLVAAAGGRFALHRGFSPPINVVRAHTGLMAWDADWYRRIAHHGYNSLPRAALRFFPLFPLLGRFVAVPLGGHVDWALLLIANGLALVLGGLIHRLALAEGAGAEAAVRATWLVALAPPAFVLVMGYSESLALCLAVAAVLALRARRWGWAAAAGLIAGLARPVGLLLVVPALIEAGQGWRRCPPRELLGRVAAVLAPAAGAGVYLLWVWRRFGDVMLPFRVQQIDGLRGRTVNPLANAVHVVGGLFRGDLGRQAHGVGVAVAIVLVALVVARWPASFGAYAVVTLIAALAAQHLGSFERYIFGAFPVILAVGAAGRSERTDRVVLVVSAVAMGGYALAAFVGAYVP